MKSLKLAAAGLAALAFVLPVQAADNSTIGAGATGIGKTHPANTPAAGSVVAPMGAGGSNFGSAQLFAVVNGVNGVVTRGKGNAATPGGGRLGVGTYDIRFFRNVAACSFTGNVSGIEFDTPAGFVSFGKRAGAPNGVFVLTRNINGVLADLNFHLYVDC